MSLPLACSCTEKTELIWSKSGARLSAKQINPSGLLIQFDWRGQHQVFYGINPLCVIVVKASSPWNLVSLKSSFCTHCGFYSVVRRQMTTCDSSGSEKNNHLWGITSTRSLMLHLRPKATPNEKHSRFVGNTEHTAIATTYNFSGSVSLDSVNLASKRKRQVGRRNVTRETQSQYSAEGS